VEVVCNVAEIKTTEVGILIPSREVRIKTLIARTLSIKGHLRRYSLIIKAGDQGPEFSMVSRIRATIRTLEK